MSMTGITVNGAPLAEYVAKTQPRKLRNKAFTNGISRDLKLPEPEPDFTQWVLIKGIQYLRAAKEPFETSGKSLKGALQYDPDTDKIKCHECGEWFECYSGHMRARSLTRTHPSAVQYRDIHGLSSTTPLAGLRYRSRCRAMAISRKQIDATMSHGQLEARSERMKITKQGRSRTIESLNARSSCPAQLPERLKLLTSQLGRTPTAKEMAAAKIDDRTVKFIFGSVNKFISACGLKPRVAGTSGHVQPYTVPLDELTQGLLYYRKMYGRWPKQREIDKSGFMHASATYQRRFGGLRRAIAIAEKRAIS